MFVRQASAAISIGIVLISLTPGITFSQGRTASPAMVLQETSTDAVPDVAVKEIRMLALSHRASRGRFSSLERRPKILESLVSAPTSKQVITSKNTFP
jgi:hypothetical protein